MNHSKYNQKYDPKHNGSQPAVAPVSVPVSATAVTVIKGDNAAQADKKAMDAKPAEATIAPQPEAKTAASAAPAALQAAAPGDAKSGEAMVSEGGHTATTNVPHAVREPGAVTDETASLPVTKVEDETGEKAPALSAKPLA